MDLGFTRHPGFQAEGLVYRPDGRIVKGLNPRNDWIPVATGDPVELYVEAAANPLVLTELPPTALGDRLTTADRAALPAGPRGPRRLETDVGELVADLEVLDGLRSRPAPTTSAPRRCSTRSSWRSTRSTSPTSPAPRRARAALADVLADAGAAGATPSRRVGHAHIDSAWLWPVRETVRKVARTFANVLALMDTDDSTWSSRCRQRPAVRLAQGALPASCSSGSKAGAPSGPLRAGRRDVGRVRHQHARRRGAGPAVRARQAVLPRGVRRRAARGLAAGLVRLHRRAPADRRRWPGRAGSSPRRSRGTRPTGSRTTRSGGRASTAPGSSPTSRRSTPTTPSSPARELAHADRQLPRQGRRRPRSLVPFGYGDGGGGPTREMLGRARRTADLEGSPRVESRRPSEFFAAAEAEYADRAPVWAGRAVPGVAPRHLHLAGRDQAGNRRSEHLLREAELWARRPPCAGCPIPVRRSSSAAGRPCCCTSSTTSCPAPRSPGCTARRDATYAQVIGRRSRRSSSTRCGALARGGLDDAGLQRRPVRPGAACRRWAPACRTARG